MDKRPYVLGTGLDEHERLGLQHRLWADAAHALWMRAGLRPGASVLDLGCGPGHAAFDLAQWVTSKGRVLGIDAAPNFIEHVNTQARSRDLPQLHGVVGNAEALDTLVHDHPPFDLVWARWVLCFVPDPARVVAAVARAMAPGGTFAVHDYFNYTSMTMAPRRASHDRAVEATAASWRANGGNPDVGALLPALMEANGLEVVHLAMHQRVARGCDPMFAWPDSWWRTWAPKLVAMNHLAQADCDALLADLDAMQSSRTEYIVPPPVTEILAIKRANSAGR